MVDKSESSSFEDLTSTAADEVEEARLAESATAATETPGTSEEWQDIIGSGCLLKKIIKKGDESENSRPERSNICKISYEVRLQEGDKHLIEKRDHVKIYLGDNEILQGMDLALTLMYKGEACKLRIAPRFAYGDAGLKPGESLGSVGETESPRYDGPPITHETWLEADLELHDWSEEPEHETLPIVEKMQIGQRRRARGNWWYGRGEPQLAVQLYRRALDVLDESEGGITSPAHPPPPDSDELHALLEERIRVQNNMAAAQLKAGAYDAALQAVRRVLSCQPENPKALYRFARILAATGRTSEALTAARAAALAAPDDPAVRRELARAESRATHDKSVERKLAKKMLGTTGDSPAKGDAPDKKPSRSNMIVWGSLLLSLLVGVASVLIYRYKLH